MTWSEESKNNAELEAQFAGAGLFMAAQNNEIENVRKQIDSGVDPNSSMNDGLTPLFMAVANNRIEMANLLIDKGAKVVGLDGERRAAGGPMHQAKSHHQSSHHHTVPTTFYSILFYF